MKHYVGLDVSFRGPASSRNVGNRPFLWRMLDFPPPGSPALRGLCSIRRDWRGVLPFFTAQMPSIELDEPIGPLLPEFSVALSHSTTRLVRLRSTPPVRSHDRPTAKHVLCDTDLRIQSRRPCALRRCSENHSVELDRSRLVSADQYLYGILARETVDRSANSPVLRTRAVLLPVLRRWAGTEE